MTFNLRVKKSYDDAELGRTVKRGEEFNLDDTERAIKLINHGVVEIISIGIVEPEPTTDPAPRTRRTRTTEE